MCSNRLYNIRLLITTLLTIFFHLNLTTAYNSPSINNPLITSTNLLPRDGVLNPYILKQWFVTYTAKNYLPTCGSHNETASAGGSAQLDWSNCHECEIAMASFNSTRSKLKSALYDLSGNVLLQPEDSKKGEDVIGGRDELKCLCFGVFHVNGRGMDVCLLVGRKGEVMERKANSGGNTAVGLQWVRDERLERMLPRCEDVSKSSATGSPTNASMPAAAPEKKPVLTTEAIIGLTVGLPGAIVALITMVTYIRKHRGKKVGKYTDVETGNVKRRSWKFWQKRHLGVSASTVTTPAVEMNAVDLSSEPSRVTR